MSEPNKPLVSIGTIRREMTSPGHVAQFGQDGDFYFEVDPGQAREVLAQAQAALDAVLRDAAGAWTASGGGARYTETLSRLAGTKAELQAARTATQDAQHQSRAALKRLASVDEVRQFDGQAAEAHIRGQYLERQIGQLTEVAEAERAAARRSLDSALLDASRAFEVTHRRLADDARAKAEAAMRSDYETFVRELALSVAGSPGTLPGIARALVPDAAPKPAPVCPDGDFRKAPVMAQ